MRQVILYIWHPKMRMKIMWETRVGYALMTFASWTRGN